MEYLYHVITMVALYCILAQSLNFFSGNTGLLSLTHAGFYGLGAYASSILSVNFHIPFFLSSLFSLSAVAFASLIVSFVAFRTRDDYFVIITLALQMIIFLTLNNLSPVTNGPIGIRNIPKLPFASTSFEIMISLTIISLAIYWLLWRLSVASWGQNLRAIREDEIMMEALGKPVTKIKTITFVISATIAGFAGILYAHYISFIDPTYFTINESINILAVIVIGGLGNIHGSFFAATFMVFLPEVLRFVGVQDNYEANIRQILFGSILVAIILKRKTSLLR